MRDSIHYICVVEFVSFIFAVTCPFPETGRKAGYGYLPDDAVTYRKPLLFRVQGLFVPFACVGSGDPVKVLRLYTTNTLDTL